MPNRKFCTLMPRRFPAQNNESENTIGNDHQELTVNTLKSGIAAMVDILVLYYSRSGSTAELAKHIARGAVSYTHLTLPTTPYV